MGFSHMQEKLEIVNIGFPCMYIAMTQKVTNDIHSHSAVTEFIFRISIAAEVYFQTSALTTWY